MCISTQAAAENEIILPYVYAAARYVWTARMVSLAGLCSTALFSCAGFLLYVEPLLSGQDRGGCSQHGKDIERKLVWFLSGFSCG